MGSRTRGHGLTFKGRAAAKSKVLANFVVEFTHNLQLKAKKKIAHIELKDGSSEPLVLYVDRASNNQSSRVRIILTRPGGETIERAIKLRFFATKNEAEYEALIVGL